MSTPPDEHTAVDQVSPFTSADPHGTQPSDPTAIVRASGHVELPPGSVVGETYEVDAKIGAGAMGEVYAARHVGLGKRVAIKVIGRRLSEDSAAIERFAMEARTLAQVQHPAIVAVDHVGELADGRAFFVMEFLRGESLFDRLARGRVPLPEALRILDQIARGLDAAHAEGVVHRDVKPENIFLVHLPGEPPIVKIVDFGLSTLRALDQRAERTQSGVAIGTPMYMSPEQARGPDVDQRTDIYALGCVAYELLLGQPPFPHARTAPELYAAHLHESPPLPRSIWPEIPPQLDLALFAMITKDPRHRPTLTQVRSVIADVRTGTPSQRAATEFVSKRSTSDRGRTWTIAIGILALVLGITIGAILMSRPSGNRVEQRDAPLATAPAPAVSMQPARSIAPATPAPNNVPISPRSRPRDGNTATRVQKSGSATISPPPIVAGTAVVEVSQDPPPTSPPINAGTAVVEVSQDASPPKPKTPDRNQTINPFAKHKVNP